MFPDKKRWKNFSIRGNYRADVQQLDIALHREDSVSLIGDRIGLRDQLALRGIAAKVFGKHQRLQILSDVVRQQPKLRNLSVTQFTIRDGWLAVAFGEPTSDGNIELLLPNQRRDTLAAITRTDSGAQVSVSSSPECGE